MKILTGEVTKGGGKLSVALNHQSRKNFKTYSICPQAHIDKGNQSAFLRIKLHPDPKPLVMLVHPKFNDSDLIPSLFSSASKILFGKATETKINLLMLNSRFWPPLPSFHSFPVLGNICSSHICGFKSIIQDSLQILMKFFIQEVQL